MKFTKEEIILCKQVAEKHRKFIEYGDWYEFKGKSYLKSISNSLTPAWHIPLWTISDCLEFLRKKDYRINLHENVLTNGIEVILNHPKRIEDITNYVYKGKTPLEACLKVVIEVLKNAENKY